MRTELLLLEPVSGGGFGFEPLAGCGKDDGGGSEVSFCHI